MTAVDQVVSALQLVIADATRGVDPVQVGSVSALNFAGSLRGVRVSTPDMDGDIAARWLPGFASSVAAGSVAVGSAVLVVWAGKQPVVVDRVLSEPVAPLIGG